MTTTIRLILAAAATGLLLSACGGDDEVVASSPPPATGGPSSTPLVPPANASASSLDFVSFVGALSTRDFEQSEPYDLSAFTLPTDNVDTLEPVTTPIDAS